MEVFMIRIVFAIVILILLSLAVALFALYRDRQISNLTHKNIEKQKNLEALYPTGEEFRQRLDQYRKYTHDINKYLTMLQDLDKNPSDLPLLNHWLDERQALLESEGIKVTITRAPAHTLKLHPMDLVGLFGNLMDNAIEAVCRIPEGSDAPCRSVEVDFLRENPLHFQIRNTADPSSCAELVAMLKDASLRQSAKDSPLSHGYGLSIVEDVVKKYDGILQWTTRDGWIIADVDFTNYHP